MLVSDTFIVRYIVWRLQGHGMAAQQHPRLQNKASAPEIKFMVEAQKTEFLSKKLREDSYCLLVLTAVENLTQPLSEKYELKSVQWAHDLSPHRLPPVPGGLGFPGRGVVAAAGCLEVQVEGTDLQGCQMAKFDPFLSLDCIGLEGVGRNRRKGRDQILQRSVAEP